LHGVVASRFVWLESRLKCPVKLRLTDREDEAAADLFPWWRLSGSFALPKKLAI